MVLREFRSSMRTRSSEAREQLAFSWGLRPAVPRSDEDEFGRDVGEVQSIAETEKALLCRRVDEGDQAWIPKSNIHDDSEVYEKGQEGILIVKTWYADKINWEEPKGRR